MEIIYCVGHLRWGIPMTKLVAGCGWKYEPEWMIEDMKKNMPWVDEFVILDCRKRDELWMHEGQYRLIIREMARIPKDRMYYPKYRTYKFTVPEKYLCATPTESE